MHVAAEASAESRKHCTKKKKKMVHDARFFPDNMPTKTTALLQSETNRETNLSLHASRTFSGKLIFEKFHLK